MNPILKIYKSRKKAGYLFLFAVVFVFFGVFLLEDNQRVVIGWSCIILGGFGMLYTLYAWFNRKPQIILSDIGISARTFRNEVIEWDAITASDEFFFRGQYYIRILVDKDYKPQIPRSGWFYRIDRIYAKNGVKAVYLNTNMLDVSSAQLNRFIHKMVLSNDAERKKMLNTASVGGVKSYNKTNL